MTNPFELLGQDENEDPQDLVAAAASKAEERQAEAAKKDSKANSQAAAKPARTQRNDRGGGRGGRAGGDRPSYSGDDDLTYPDSRHRGGGSRPGNKDRGGRGGYGGDDGRRHKREYDRHSATGRGMEVKKGGAGKANWGKETDNGAPVTPKAEGGDEPEDVEGEEMREEDDKEMTYEEYEKQMAEKKMAMKNLNLAKKDNAGTSEGDKKEFDGMEEVGKKGDADEIFLRVGEAKKKEGKASKTMNKQTLETNFKPGGEQTRSDQRGSRGGGRGGRDGRRVGERGGGRGVGRRATAPRLDDDSAFPGLGK